MPKILYIGTHGTDNRLESSARCRLIQRPTVADVRKGRSRCPLTANCP